MDDKCPRCGWPINDAGLCPRCDYTPVKACTGCADLRAKLQMIADRAGKWMSAALDDEKCCQECKDDFRAALEAMEEGFR